MKNKLTRMAVVILLGITAVFVMPAAANADNVRARASCEVWPSTGTGAPYLGNLTAGYAYSPLFTTHSWSGCQDIQSPWRNNSGPYPTTLNTWFRVRFYPSGGGNYANSWKSNNISIWSNLIIATNVADNTTFRVETQRRLADGSVAVEPHNFDLMF